MTLVKRLLLAQFPQWADLPIRRVASSGTDNALYRLGDEMVVRLPRIYWAVAGIEKEQRWLPRLAPYLPVAIPVPLGQGTPGEGYPWHWSVLRWLEGENPSVDHIPDPGLLARQLVDFITALRQIEATDGLPTGHTLAARDNQVRRDLAALRDMIDTDAVTTAWEAELKTPEWAGPPVWLHGDIAPGNMLLVDGRLSAIIDFSGVGVGDPSIDLQVAWNLLPASVRNDFRAALGVDEATWQRGRAQALAQALVQLPYYHITNPSLAANSRHVIKEVLADHRRNT